MSMELRRPTAGEFAEYYNTYIGKIDNPDILGVLKKNGREAIKFYNSIPEDKWNAGYAPGKWTLKEALIHVIDTEQIFAYRALRIARGDKTPMAGFDQNEYVPYSSAKDRSIKSILKEYKAMRRSTYLMFKNFDAAMWDRLGTASDNPVSVRALAFMIAGHEKHHIMITKENYI